MIFEKQCILGMSAIEMEEGEVGYKNRGGTNWISFEH